MVSASEIVVVNRDSFRRPTSSSTSDGFFMSSVTSDIASLVKKSLVQFNIIKVVKFSCGRSTQYKNSADFAKFVQLFFADFILNFTCTPIVGHLTKSYITKFMEFYCKKTVLCCNLWRKRNVKQSAWFAATSAEKCWRKMAPSFIPSFAQTVKNPLTLVPEQPTELIFQRESLVPKWKTTPGFPRILSSC